MNRRDLSGMMAESALLPMASRAGLRGRLGPILDAGTDRRSVPAWAIAITSAATVAIVPFLAAARLTRADPPPTIAPAATRPAAAPPVTRPAVDAAALVREVRAAEAWIDRVDSFRVQVTDTWSAVHPQPNQFAGTGAIDLGWDRHRFYKRSLMPGGEPVQDRGWDGRQSWSYERYAKPQAGSMVGGKWVSSDELYALLGDTPAEAAESFWGDLAWGRAGARAFWWMSADDRDQAAYFAGLPDQVRLAGQETFRGVDCYRLACDHSLRDLLVGVADHRLYGIEQFAFPSSNAAIAAAVDGVEAAIAKDFGHPLHGELQWQAWLTSLPPDQRRRADDEYGRRGRQFARLQLSQWMTDYKDVAHDRWFPMRQGYDLWDVNKVESGDPLGTRRVEVVTSVTVNQPLPDGYGVRVWKEGVPVNDWGHKPPLMYRYKKQFTPAEWQAILDEGNQRQADEQARTRTMNAAVGRPAAEFPPVWAQGKPVTLADLKGKVTVVAFWASWCGPCRNDVESLNRFAGESTDTGIGVLSVHACGTPVADVRKAIADEKISYPVCVDLGGGDNAFGGTVFAAAHVVQLPSAMVIDRTGTIAAVGSLGDAWATAARLASEQPTTQTTH